jgi:hypothetical protein
MYSVAGQEERRKKKIRRRRTGRFESRKTRAERGKSRRGVDCSTPTQCGLRLSTDNTDSW